MTHQKSQLILPVTIATLMTFAFMALIIYNGELQFSAPKPADYNIKINYVTHHCSRGIDTDIATLPIHEKATHSLATLCNHKESCVINTKNDIVTDDRNPFCTSEIIVRFFCLKDTQVKYVLEEKPSIAFLYEGQTATLSCSNFSDTRP